MQRVVMVLHYILNAFQIDELAHKVILLTHKILIKEWLFNFWNINEKYDSVVSFLSRILVEYC